MATEKELDRYIMKSHFRRSSVAIKEGKKWSQPCMSRSGDGDVKSSSGRGKLGDGQLTLNINTYSLSFPEGHSQQWDAKPHVWVMTSYLVF